MRDKYESYRIFRSRGRTGRGSRARSTSFPRIRKRRRQGMAGSIGRNCVIKRKKIILIPQSAECIREIAQLWLRHLHEALRMVELAVRVDNLGPGLEAVKAAGAGDALHVRDSER